MNRDAVQVVRSPGTDAEAHTEAATLERPTGAVPIGVDAPPPLLAGRYEILGMLGSGGMGTVYRARDRELDEVVALKVLRRELASSETMLERFRREVKLARRVTHRNVARTFDIGDHEGDRFLTMELVEGEMLGNHLARRGRVPVREVIAIARDVCAGLSAAHAAGVLHRDLKPENVIIARDGHAVITDFGIARALASADLARTAASGMVGTPAYMAPEQVEGAPDLDARADLYALGTMLFELLTGASAWPGDSVVAVAAARLLKPPPDARKHRPEIPEPVAELVRKLMARDRAHRFASADEADQALQALDGVEAATGSARSVVPAATVTAPPIAFFAPTRTPQDGASARAARKSVAVLPLLNLGVADDDYLAESVTEDLVDLLSMVRELRVRPRGETMRFRETSRDVRDAGRSLGVDVVVDATLRRIADVVRVSVRLVTVEDGYQLWARRFDSPAARVLNVADEAAAAIARALATELNAEARAVPDDALAQELFLRGRHLVHRGWFEVSRDGIAMLREAHARAPGDPRIAGTYALALARSVDGDVDQHESVRAARLLAEKTLAAARSQPEALIALSVCHLADADGPAAAQQLRRALQIAPNSVEALDAAGRLLIEVGPDALGISMLQRTLAIDPTVSHARHAIVRAHVLAGNWDIAMEALNGQLILAAEDVTAQMMIRTRLTMWKRDKELAANQLDELATSGASAFGKRSIGGMLRVVLTNALGPLERKGLEEGLPFDKRHHRRRLAFYAQLRTEIKLVGSEVDEAFADLRFGDENGLLDLIWLDHCPVFEGHRSRRDFLAIRARTALRAEAVVRAMGL